MAWSKPRRCCDAGGVLLPANEAMKKPGNLGLYDSGVPWCDHAMTMSWNKPMVTSKKNPPFLRKWTKHPFRSPGFLPISSRLFWSLGRIGRGTRGPFKGRPVMDRKHLTQNEVLWQLHKWNSACLVNFLVLPMSHDWSNPKVLTRCWRFESQLW